MIAGLPLLAWPRGDACLTILIYHRVMAKPDSLRPGEADAAGFERQIAFLSRHFDMMSLVDAVRALKGGRLPRRPCCVTFDDGYADNLLVAQPLLNQYHVPATVFVATGYLDGGRMFNDTVIECVRQVRGRPLDLSSMGMGVLSLFTDVECRAAIETILAHLKYLEPVARDAAVNRLVSVSGCGRLPDDLMLTTPQLRELSSHGIEIGGHTVAHTVLTTLGHDEARAEISTGKRAIEKITGKQSRLFAYPNGRPERDYRLEHARLVEETGFEAAVTTASGVSAQGADLFQLPRFTPWGQSIPLFSARLMRNARNRGPSSMCVAA